MASELFTRALELQCFQEINKLRIKALRTRALLLTTEPIKNRLYSFVSAQLMSNSFFENYFKRDNDIIK